MSTAKSSVSSKSSGAVEADQASAYSKDVFSRCPIDALMVQNVRLIWLDNSINENSSECRNTVAPLQHAVNTIDIFTDGDQCIQFLENIINDKACMIISGALGEHIVPRIHNMSQLDSIFIFCGNKKRHEQWVKEWPKVRGVFTELKPICDALKQATQQCEQNAIPISFVTTNDDPSKKSLDQLERSFMYTQILEEILLKIDFKDEHLEEFIEYCREVLTNNQGELKNVKKLKHQYRNETPIWWYTSEFFLYPMLNRALRLMDVDIIIRMGFFIMDLHRQIERLHSEQFGGDNSSSSFTVYRGQGMGKEDFEKMTKTKGGFISFNNFLMTSKKSDVSLNFANRAATNPDLVGILFVMTIDPSKSTTPFASITNVSFYKDKEDEVLFSMHTVFRISNITPMSEKQRLFQVELTLANDNDEDLRRLTDRIREETCRNSTGWYRLSLVLRKIGQFKKAEKVCEIILDQATEDSEKAHIYRQIGWAKCQQREYKETITLFEKELEINKKILPLNDPHLATSYNNIGLVYDNMGEYSKALSSHEKALEIRKQSLPPNDLDLAMSYNNIGLVYNNMGEYSKALSYYEKDLEIKKQSLPSNHPDLAMSYSDIGNVYFAMSDYSKAFSFCKRAVEIGQELLPSNHPDLQWYRNNFDKVKNKF